MSVKKRTIWSAAHIAVLVQHYETATPAFLVTQLGRTWNTIREKAQSLNIKRRPGEGHWSEQELTLMREEYASKGGLYMMQVTGRSAQAVHGMARKLGLRLAEFGKQPRKTNWSDEHLRILREEYPLLGPDRVAAMVGRKPACVISMAKRLRIRCRIRPCGRPWSAEHRALLIEHYPAGLPLDQLCALVGGRKKDTVMQMASQLKLRRPARVKAEPALKSVPAPKPKVVATPPVPMPKVDKAVKKLVKEKAKAKVAQKAAAPEPAKKWYHFPMHSDEYKAGLAATTAGKKPTTILDTNGRPATVWRNAA